MNHLRSILKKNKPLSLPVNSRPARVFLLDDNTRRHGWFHKRFAHHKLDITDDVKIGLELLRTNVYAAIFLDHDLLPEHYHSNNTDETRTGYAIASWLATHPEAQSHAAIIVHTRNADGALKMIDKMRNSGRKAEYVPFSLLNTDKIISEISLERRNKTPHTSLATESKKTIKEQASDFILGVALIYLLILLLQSLNKSHPGQKSVPPSAEALLSSLLSEQEREVVIGDLYEEYEEKVEELGIQGARIWIYRQTFTSARVLIWERIKLRVSKLLRTTAI